MRCGIPSAAATLVAISAGLRPDGWGTATRHLQRELVRDGLRNGDIATGMMRARQLGMLTYRGRDELDTRFGKLLPELERPPVADYLDHHGRRFAERFPVKTFLLLSEAIDRGIIGDDARARRAALDRVTADTIIVGVPGDMLFPFALQVELHRELQAAGAQSSLWKLESLYGHDAFLADQDRLADVLRGAGAFGSELRDSARPRYAGRRRRAGARSAHRHGRLRHRRQGRARDDREAAAAPWPIATACASACRESPCGTPPGTAGRSPQAFHRPTSRSSSSAIPRSTSSSRSPAAWRWSRFCRTALATGKPVVTANKALLAAKLDQLGVLAQRTATPLYCEAAAAAALPIIRHLSHRADEIDSLWGIVNGTSNFVLTRLEQDEMSIDAAVLDAQSKGLAEADASADIDGQDAADKLSILTYRAFGAWVRPTDFPVRGIRDLTPADCDLAESMGCRIRLIARAARLNGALDMAVEPLLLPTWHLLASVEEEYNAVYLRCASSGDLSLFGMGAGAMPTATAVLGDLIDLAQDNSVRWPEPRALPLARAGRRGGTGRHGATSCASSPTRIRASSAASTAWYAGFGLMAQNHVARADHDCLLSGVHDLAELRREDWRSCRTPSPGSPACARASASECSSDRRGWRQGVARSGELPGRTAAARRDGGRHASSARGARRAREADRAPLSPSRRSDRPARSVRIGPRHRVAGRQSRLPVRERRLLVGAASSLRALRDDRDGRPDRAAEGARAGGLRARL